MPHDPWADPKREDAKGFSGVPRHLGVKEIIANRAESFRRLTAWDQHPLRRPYFHVVLLEPDLNVADFAIFLVRRLRREGQQILVPQNLIQLIQVRGERNGSTQFAPNFPAAGFVRQLDQFAGQIFPRKDNV